MDRLTRQDVEAVLVEGMCKVRCSEPCLCSRVRDLALQSLSQEAVRLRDADILAAAVDDFIQRGLLDSRSLVADCRLDYGQPFTSEQTASHLERRRHGKNAALKREPLEEVLRVSDAGGTIVSVLKREPNAAGWNEKGIADIGLLPGEVDATIEPVPAAPDVASMVKRAIDEMKFFKSVRSRVPADAQYDEWIALLAKLEQRDGMDYNVGRADGFEAAQQLETAWRKDNYVPSEEYELRVLVDQAYGMMQMAGYRIVEQNSEHNNPIVAWMAKARTALKMPPLPGASDE